MITNDSKQIAVNLKLEPKAHENLRKLAVATGLTNEVVVSELLRHISHDTALKMLNEKMLEKKRLLAEKRRQSQTRRMNTSTVVPERNLTVDRVRQLLSEITRAQNGESESKENDPGSDNAKE